MTAAPRVKRGGLTAAAYVEQLQARRWAASLGELEAGHGTPERAQARRRLKRLGQLLQAARSLIA